MPAGSSGAVPPTPNGLIWGVVGPAVDPWFDTAAGVVGIPDRAGAGVTAPAGSGSPACAVVLAPGFGGVGTDGSLGTLP